jgi:hypothetical protein
MAQYKNKAYANNSRSGSPKDYSGYHYHKTQELKQDKLIADWLKTKADTASQSKRK